MKHIIYTGAMLMAMGLYACSDGDNTSTVKEAPNPGTDGGNNNGDVHGTGNGYQDNNMAPASDTGQYDNSTDENPYKGSNNDNSNSNPANQSSKSNGNDPGNEKK